MKNFLQITRKISFLTFVFGVCLFSTQAAFSQKTWVGSAGGAWSTAGNWNPSGVPAATDEVTINEGADVHVTASTTCQKLIINGSTSLGQGKVTVDFGATLNVGNANTATLATVILYGGIIDNKGSLSITGRQALDAMRLDNAISGNENSTYMGTGSLTCTTSASGTGGGGSGQSGASVTFAQTNGTATFTVGGTYTFTTVGTLNQGTPAVPTSKSVFYCPKGSALINGAGSLTISGDKRAIRVAPNANTETPNLTIEAGVIMNLSSTMGALSSGIVIVENASAASGSATSSITNKGTLNFSAGTGGTGVKGNPIGLTNGSNAVNTSNFSNEGIININGPFTDNTTNLTLGGIYMGGAAANFGTAFTNTNTGVINFNTTASGTSTKPLFYSNTSNITITNNGTITIGTNGSPITAIQLGDSKSTMNNAGTITVGEGNITGTAGNGNAAFNNNGGGILNFVLAPATSAISGNVTFTNAGGMLKGSGTFSNTGGNLFTSGSIAPGQSPGQIILPDASLTLNGTYSAEINGKTTAGTDFDQIKATSATVNVSGLTISVLSTGYTPTNGDVIPLIDAANITGTPTFILPASWSGSVSGGQISITFNTVLPTELTAFKATPLSNMNLLTWETASEINNKGFDIQRQTQAGAWETLGFMNGAGKATTYTFTDKTPLSISYYRLRQVDLSGTEMLSKVVSVIQNTKGRISITPNPTSDKVNIHFNQDNTVSQAASIALFDMTGRQVLKQSTTADVLQLDLSSLAKGMYVMTVQSNNAVYQEKIIRQ